MSKTYTVECGSTSGGTTYTVIVHDDSQKSKYFCTKVKKSKLCPQGKTITARQQLDEYISYLTDLGYERTETQMEKDLREFTELGGDFDKFVKNIPRK